VNAWENDFHRSIDPIEIEVIEGVFISGGIEVIGGTQGSHIRLTRTFSSKTSGLPALYHELCHRESVSAKYGTDFDHEDPRWPDWTRRSLNLGNE
jgi:hypothetical protein